MNTKYPKSVQQILNKWLEKITELSANGKIDSGTVKQVEKLLIDGEVENVSKVKAILLKKGD